MIDAELVIDRCSVIAFPMPLVIMLRVMVMFKNKHVRLAVWFFNDDEDDDNCYHQRGADQQASHRVAPHMPT